MLDKILAAIKFLAANWAGILTAGVAVVAAGAKALFALSAVFLGLGAFFLLIPGKHPEDWFFKLGGLMDKAGKFVEKYSKK